jgi:hypothetical protein
MRGAIDRQQQVLVGPQFAAPLHRSPSATSVASLNRLDYANYIYDNGQLAWTAGFNARIPSVYAGSVRFSDIAQPTDQSSAAGNPYYNPAPPSSYTGPIFSGTVATTVKGSFDPVHGTPLTVTTYSILGELVPELKAAN